VVGVSSARRKGDLAVLFFFALPPKKLSEGLNRRFIALVPLPHTGTFLTRADADSIK